MARVFISYRRADGQYAVGWIEERLREISGDDGVTTAFRDSDLHKLAFLSRARALGFTIEDCRTLLTLYEDQSRASADVKDLAEAHLHKIEDKIVQLQSMRDTLSELVRSCAGDSRPDCPILKDLSALTN